MTEAGFGADMGMEKFFNIKCRASKLVPDCVVLVATVKALKMHGGGGAVVAGKKLPLEYRTENLPMLSAGLPNLLRHVDNAGKFGVPVVVCINRFRFVIASSLGTKLLISGDSQAEIDVIKSACASTGAFSCVSSNHWAEGGVGALDLANSVIDACTSLPSPNPNFRFLYPLSWSLEKKIRTVCVDIYGAIDVEFSDHAREKLALYTKLGYSELPVCMAKTQYSFSHDPLLKNAPSGFTVPVRDIRASIGAGFVFPLLGEMQTMPGLPTRPAFYDVDVDPVTGRVVGLF